MTSSVTKDQAVQALQLLTAEHSKEGYFKRAEVVAHDIGYGVDLWVDKEKWNAANGRAPGRIEKVPICVVLVG